MTEHTDTHLVACTRCGTHDHVSPCYGCLRRELNRLYYRYTRLAQALAALARTSDNGGCWCDAIPEDDVHSMACLDARDAMAPWLEDQEDDEEE